MTSKTAGTHIGFFLALTAILLPLTSCGSGGGGGGGGVDYDYGISLTPDKTMVAPGGTVNLNVKYDAPKNNAGITWTVACLQTDCGSVSANGIYSAPAQVEAQMKVGIKATSKDKPTSGYYVEIWITGPIHVTISPDWPINLAVGATQQFTATVNSPDTGIIWQVNGVTGGNTTIGTISSTGLFTAPAGVPDPDTVTVTAVAHCDQTASVSHSVTITPPPQIVVLISPTNQTVNINATLQFTATVQNTSDTAVIWQVNGVTGGNSTAGTISTGGLFTAPAEVPTPATVTVTAVSHADPTRSGSTYVAIVNLKNSMLSGPYAFEISGPDSSEQMRAAIGYLNFDGNGKFVAMLDLNQMTLTGGAQTASQFSGTYSVGQDMRGKLTFTFNPALTFAFTLDAASNDAKLVEYDQRGTHYTGYLQKQIPNDFLLSKLSGDYAFSLYGVTSTGIWQAAIGRFHADGAGNLTNAAIDVAETGQAGQTITGATGTVVIADSTRGRGTITFALSGSDTARFSFYMTNAGDIFLLSSDPVPDDNPLMVGRIVRQTGAPFSNASVDGTAVFGLWGDGITNSADSCLVVGKWTATSSTQTLSGIQDILCDGGVSLAQPWTATYSIATNGRGQMGGGTQMANVFYMIAKNKAFLLNTLGQHGLIGMAEPQQVSSFSNALFTGTYRIGPISMPKPDADLSQGFLTADGAGSFTGTEDVLGTDLLAFTFTGTYSVDTTGRTLITFINPETFHYVAYPISSTRFIGISIEPNDALANLGGLDQ